MTDMCIKQVACDGTPLRGNRRSIGVCTACESALLRRGKEIAPRGLNYRDNMTASEVRRLREQGRCQ